MSPAARDLAAWALGLRLGDVPGDVRRAATRHVLDALGCAVAAARSGAADPAVRTARALGGTPEATILGQAPGTGRVSRAEAAFANGVLTHALDFDDTHAGGLVHASAPVLPVALAEAEALGLGGADLLLGVVAGLETLCRLGAAAPHGFHARGLHATSVCGVVAAALTSARMRGLTLDQTTDALGIAGSQAGGLLEFLNTGASTKQLHPGFAARGGVLAATLAGFGATGPDTVIEGRYGLYGALLDRRIEPAAVLAGLGERWELTRITVKPYPACQLMHAQLDAARGLHGAAVASVTAEVHPDAASIVCAEGKERPRTAYDAKFSLPWSVAAMIIDGEVTAATYAVIDRPEVLDLASRIRTRVVDFGGAAADQPGRLRAVTRDGEELVAEVPRSGGGPDDPDIEGTVRGKALANLGSAERVDLILGLPDLASVRPLLTALEEA
ncbi:MmgE/PrpD family protein [Spirillospora sp. NBC_01491]|uniref:MmgE/PrpD family protein n=1 Tax=Spirillospora sp. NBC_01491 TaxID=2976007 RepID=UPI002E30448F|nr:MmgE/PrpD family protein [Spirillospora sp. NBC_01491]